jgi:hypothetical protein
MAVNPYVVPARYQYQSLPANFLLEAGMRKQNQFDTANAGLEAFKSSLALTPGYKTVDRAKALEQNYLSQVQPLVDEFLQTGNAQSIVPKLSRLQSQFQSDPERRAIQNDFELKPLAAKVMSDPTLMDRGYHTITDAQGNVIQTKAGEEITPQIYGVLPESTLRSSFDDYAKEIQPEIEYKDGIPQRVKVDEDEDGNPVYKDVTKTTTVNSLTEEYFRNRFKNLTESGRYKETPFYQWYTKKNNTDIDAKQMEDLLVNEYATKFFKNSKDDYSSTNVAKTGDDSGKGKKEQLPFLEGRSTEPLKNVYVESSLKEVLAPDNKDRLGTMLAGTKYDSAAEDATLERQGLKVNRDEAGEITGIVSTTSKSLSKADENQKILDLNAKRDRAESMSRAVKLLEDDIQKIRVEKGINSIAPEDQSLLSRINQIKSVDKPFMGDIKTGLKSYFIPNSVTPEELAKTQEKSFIDYYTMVKSPSEFKYAIDKLSPEEQDNFNAVKEYVDNQAKYSKIEDTFGKYKKAENQLIIDKFKGFDESKTALILEDYKNTNRPEDVAFAGLINTSVMGGNARGVYPDAKSPELRTDNALKWDNSKYDFQSYINSPNYNFNPQNIYFDNGRVFSRGRFETTLTGEDAPLPSEYIDVDITNLMQDKLPELKKIQEQVYAGMQEQMQYIPAGEQSEIKLFGNDIKVTRSDDGTSFDIAPNSFFEYNNKTGELGLNKETKTYNNSGEAAYDVLQGAFRQQQLREARPYYFEETSKDNFKYVGDKDPKEIEQRKELVGKASKDWAEQFGWGEAFSDKLNEIIGFETANTYSTSIPNGKTGKAVGLIQFYPDGTEKVNGVDRPYKVIGVGNSKRKYYIDDIAKMSIAEQFLGPITDYFEEHQAGIKSPDDLYLAVISPNGILKTDKYQNTPEKERKDLKLKDFGLDDKFYTNNEPWFTKGANLEDMKNTTIGELLENVFDK